MTNQGRLQEWNDEKGYGFICPQAKGRRIFAHIHEFKTALPRPQNGDAVLYRIGKDSRGRRCAVRIERPELPLQHSPWEIPVVLIFCFLFWVGVLTVRGLYPPEVPVSIGLLSLLSYLQYALDKKRARQQKFRIPERRLHTLDLLGGWPGGWIAQLHFHHKTRKTSFRLFFYLTIMLHTGFVVALAVKPELQEFFPFREVLPRLLQQLRSF